MAAQYHQPIVWYTSPIHSRHPTINASTRMGSAMRDLSLNRISSANFIALLAPFQASKLFFRIPFHSQQHMATNNNLAAEDINKKQAEHEEKKSPPPPPPEKPESGDCCGSGCVRCVWDVYYEELEAYNKLNKSDSNFADSKQS